MTGNHTPNWVWICAYLAAGLCAAAFLVIDPQPNLLLAVSAGLNAGILIWSGCEVGAARSNNHPPANKY